VVNAEAGHQEKSGGGTAGVFVALAPWVLFTVVAEHGTLKIASIVALVVAVAIAARSKIMGGSPKILELAAVASFVGFTVVAFIADPSTASWLERYARAIAAAILALIAFTSVLTVPFTEQYAREQIPRQYWSSPKFKSVNRRLSLLWGLVFVAMVPGHVVAGIVNERPTNIILNWVVPIMLVLWGIRQTDAITSEGDH
jgi:hypothetical protein